MRRAATVLVLALALAGCSGPERPSRPGPADDPAARISTPGADPALAARAAHTMTALTGGDLLVTGGCDVDGCTTATSSTFVLSGGRATPAADLAQARDAHTAVRLDDGRVLVAGGFAGEGRPPLAGAELFDPTTGQWSSTGSMRLGRGGHAAALLGDGRVLVAGGWVAPSTYTDSTEIYDPATGSFSPGPRLPVAVDGLAAAPLPDGCVLVVGGQRSSRVATDRAAEVCPDGSLRSVGPLTTARFKHGIAALASGRVVVVGGTSDDDSLLADTEVYDPRTRRFSPGPRLSAGRYKLTDSVVVLPGDRLVVAGGGRGVELVDLAANRSAPIGALDGGRRSFSTVGVSAGRLVLLGGYDESIRLTRTYRSIPLADL